MSRRLEIDRITVCRFSCPGSTFRIFFAQNAAENHCLGGFPTWSLYLWYSRSIERRFKPDLASLDVGWKLVASQYVDFRPPDSHFGFFSPKMLREKHRLGGFPTWSMYLWYIRSIERRFQPDFTCWAVGWKSVASRYVDFRPPDSNFGFFRPKCCGKTSSRWFSFLIYVYVIF